MANIDDELLFLRDAKDGDGLIAREAIAYALYTIYNDRMYPPTTLDVTENGTYIAESIEKPFGTINVNVEGTTKFYDGVADIFTITENGTYYSQDMFNGKNLIIQEFEVDVPTLTVDLQPLTVNTNGTYIAENGQAFAPVTVNIPNAKKPGDYVTASMYFFDPNNPNDSSYIFIDKDDHILFGESARHFLERFPRFRNINGYSHIDWNPKPDSVTADQWFIPTWENTPVDYVEEERYIDYDIFLYIVRHKLLEYFFDLEQTIRVMIDDTEQELHCYGKGITDADGHQTNYCFYMDSTDELASYNYKKPMYCSNDISDITSESPIDGDSYYGYKCSLIRALINRDRSGLVRQSDIDIYDNSNWSIYHFIPQTLLNDIIPMSYYTSRPKRVSNSNPFKTKDVPRKNIELVQGPDTYREVVERTGNPREQGWYEYNSTNKTFILTTDTTIRAGKMYYIKGSSYDISVDEPFVSDEYEKMSVGTAWSAYDKNIRHSPILFINQSSGRYTAYKKVNGELVEYTANDHIKYINTHTGSGTGYYLYWWCIWGVREKIMYIENLQQRFDFLMENLYRIDRDTCVYLYNKESKIYYTFDPTKTDETDAYNSCVRHDKQTDPSFISAVDAGIANNTYTKAFEFHNYNQSGGNGKGHIYNSEYDIWPDESYNVYASGDYFEKSTGTHIDPDTGDIYTVSFYYYKDDCNDIEDHYFYNYYDLMNGRSDCAPAYHYVRRNNSYILERVSTDYDDYNEETVTYNIEYVTEKVSDKVMAKPINNSIKYNVFVPPYYGYEGTGPDYYPIKRYNIINTPLIEYVSIIKKLENEGYNDKNIIISESDLRGADPYCSFISSNRNNNRNIFADESTINAFDVRRANNASSPNIYPLYSYEEASAIWQTKYDNFTPNYHLRGPHNSYQYVDGTPEKYDVLYFYL